MIAAPANVPAGTGFGLVVSAEDQFGNVDQTFTNNPVTVNATGVGSISLSSGGSGYSNVNPPQVTIGAPPSGGTQAAATAVVSTGGVVTAITITNPGSGYLTAPMVTIGGMGTGTPGSGAVATATLGVTTTSQNGVAIFTGVTLNSVATDVTLPVTSTALPSAPTATSPFNVTTPQTTQLVVPNSGQPPATAIAGTPFTVTVDAETGLGVVDTTYNGPVTIGLANNTSGAVLGGVIAISPTTAGSGYSSTNPPAVTFSGGGGRGAAATAIVGPGGAITGFIITNPGTGYTSAPTVGIAAPPSGGHQAVAGATISATTVAAVNGVATFSLALNQPGTFTLQASSGTLTPATTTAVTVSDALATQLIVSTQPPASAAAGGTFGLTVTAENEYGRTDSTFNGPVTVSILNNPGGAAFTPVTVTAHNGVATFPSSGLNSLSLNNVGVGYTFVVSNPSNGTNPLLSSIATGPITITASQLAVTAEPTSSVTAGSPFSVTVKAEDSSGNFDPTFHGSVTLALASGSPSGSTLGGTLTATASGGVATFTGLSLNKVGNVNLTATSTGQQAATTPTPIAVTASTPTQLQVTTTTLTTTTTPAGYTVASGAGFGITVSALDQFGNVATGFSSSVSASLSSGPNGGGLFGTKTATFSQGVATFPSSDLSLNLVGSYTLSLTSGAMSATLGPIVVTPGQAMHLIVSPTPPTSVAPNNAFTISIMAEDAALNLITPAAAASSGFAGTVVTLTLASGPSGASATISPMTFTVTNTGVATFNVTLPTASTTPYTFTASAILPAVSGTTPVTVTTSPITVSSAGATSLELLSADEPPASVQVGAGFNVTVRAVDSNGNVFQGYNGLVTLAFAPGGNPTGALLSGTTSVSAFAQNGVATFSGLTINTMGTGYTLQATANGIPAAQPTTSFNVTAATATQLVVTTEPTPSTISAGGTFSVVVTAEDPFGNQDTSFGSAGQTVTISMASNAGNATFIPVPVTAVNGVATFTGLTLTSAGAGYTFSVSSTSNPTLTGATTTALTVTPASPAKVVLTTQPPSSVTAGSPFGFTAKVEDTYGNAYKGYPGSITVSAAPGNNLGGATFTPVIVPVSAAGLADFTGLLSLNQPATGDALQLTSTTATFGTLMPVTTNTFSVTSSMGTQLVVTGGPTPSAATAGGNISLTVSAEDQFGNPDTTFSGNVSVVLTNNTTGAILGGVTTVAAVNGVATFTGLTVNTVGSGYTFQASSQDSNGNPISTTSGPFSVSAGQATQLLVTTEPPLDVTVGSTFILAVTAYDASGNLASSFGSQGQIVTLTLATNPGGANFPTVKATATNGIAMFTGLTLNKAGSGYQFAVSSPGLTGTTTGTTNATAAGATQLGVTTQPPSTVQAGTPFSFAVSAEDSNGNPVTNFIGDVTVSLGTNPGTGTVLGAPLTQPAVNGVAMFTGLTLNKAFSGYTLLVSSTGMNTASTAPFAVTAGPVAQLMVTGEPPTDVAPGSMFQVAVTAEDAEGNPNSSFTGNVTMALGTNPGGAGAALGGTLTVAAVGGVANFTDLTLNPAASGYTLVAKSGSFSATSAAIDVSATAATQLVVTAQPPTTVVAGDQFGLTVSAEDSLGNVDAGFGGQVTLTTPSGTLTTTAINGVATFFPVTLTTAGTGFTLQASANGVTSATTNSIQVTAATATTLMFFTEPPASVPAGNFFQVTVAAEDAYGNVNQNYSGQIMIGLASNPDGAPFAPMTVTISAGEAVVTGLAIDKATPAGDSGYTLQATDTSGKLSAGTSTAVTVTAAAATQLVVTSQPQSSLTAGSVFTVAISAEDQFGNVDPSFGSSVTLTLEKNGASTSTPLNGTLTMSAVNGVATFANLSLDTAASGYTIVASTNSNLAAVPTSPLTVIAGVPAALLLTTQPSGPITAGQPFNIVVEAADQFGNLNTSYTQPVTVQLTTSVGGSTLGGTTTLTAQGGMVTFSDLTLDRPGSGDVITVSSPGGSLPGITTNPISVNVGAPEQLAVTSQPSSSVTAGSSTISLIVTAEDAGGNPTPTYNGLVTLSLASGPAGATLGGNLQAQAVNGVATFSSVSLDEAGDYTLRATGAGLTAAAVTSPISVVAAPATHVIMSVLPPGAVNAGVAFGLTVAAVDANGNTDETYSGTVSLQLNSPAGVAATLGGTTLNVPITNGVATFSDLTLNKVASGYTITATTSGGFAVTSPAINVNPAPVSQLVVTTQPTPNPVTAGNLFTVTVTAEDVDGNVVPSFSGQVSLALLDNPNPGAATLSGTLKATAVAGVATFANLSLNAAGSGYTFQATFAALSVQTGPITVNAGVATQLELSIPPPADATIGSGFEVQVKAVDNFGNVDPTFNGQVMLSLQSNPAGATLGGTTSVQNASSGVANFTNVTLNKIGSGETLLATSPTNPKLTSALTSAITVEPAAATQLIITTTLASQYTAGSPFDVTVKAEDSFGDVDPTYSSPVTLTVEAGAGGTPVNFTTTLNAVAGQVTFPGVTLVKSATGLTIQISSDSLPVATTSPFDVVAGKATQLDLTTGPPTSVAAGQTFGLVVTALDTYDNLATSFSGNVSLALGNNAPAGTALNGTTTTAAFNGVATFFGLSLNKVAGGDTIQVSSSGLSSVTAGPIAVSPGAAAQLVLTSAPTPSFAAGTPFGLTLVVEDANGNVNTAYNGNVTVSLVSNPGGAGATLGGNVTVPAVNGTASFTDLRLDTAASGYMLQATSGNLVPATTGGLVVSAAPAAQLVLTTAPPSTVNANSGFGLAVTAHDAFGNLAASFNGPVTLSLAAGSPGGASLGGPVTVTASGGVATFSGVTLNAAANGAALQVTSNGLSSAQTAGVSVIAPPPTLQSVTVMTEVIKHKKVKVIVLQFDSAISATAAVTKSNYSLATVANGKKHPSKGVPLVQPVYNLASHQVILRTKNPLVLTSPLHLAVNVTGQNLLVTLGKTSAAISPAVAVRSEAIGVESVASSHTLDALLHAGFRPKFRHLSQ